MALIKEIKTDYGTTASYWKIAETNINWSEDICFVVLVGYFNKEARISKKIPLTTRTFNFEKNDFPLKRGEEENILNILYNKIKTVKIKTYIQNENGEIEEKEIDGEFNDAQDDL